jgi:DNA-binding NtrC family response regulator
MNKIVVVLDANKKQLNSLCTLLADNNYQPASMNSLSEMEQQLEQSDCKAVIVNLDNISVTNKNFRTLKQKKSAMSIIALSERQFHPELEESLREYISVCLAKPIDSDELLFWLKGIFENGDHLQS